MRARFRREVRRALADTRLQAALDGNAERRLAARAAAFASLEEADARRRKAREIRQNTLAHLDEYLDQFMRCLREKDVHVHLAADARQACAIVVELARRGQAEMVAKSKSMVSEEIGLNHALERAGIRPVETDLGEFIVQLRGEAPSHIISPIVHLTREQAGETLARSLGIACTADVEVMAAAVRRALRQVFLSAPIGISGVNFGVAESGTLCLVTNEGNGRMVVTLPAVHIALMGVERLVPRLEDLAVMLDLLPRSATGQALSTYVSLLQAPAGASDVDGPTERHVVLVDNGRRRMRDSSLGEALLCIRCGACLNACPVFREIGGHAYGSIYPGPIGAVISPGLFGFDAFGHLAKASTLCGACQDICPVGIDLPTMLLRVRDEYAKRVPQPPGWRAGMRLYAWLMEDFARYRMAQRLGAWVTGWLPRKEGWVRFLPPPLGAWTRSRHFPPFARRSFLQQERPLAADLAPRPMPMMRTRGSEAAEERASRGDVRERFAKALDAAGGILVHTAREKLPDRLAAILREAGARSLLVSKAFALEYPDVEAHLRNHGFYLLTPEGGGQGPERIERLMSLEGADTGLTEAVAGLAETGTVVLSAGPGRSQLASLLPPVHLAVLRARDLHANLEAWLAAGGGDTVRKAPAVMLVSGPSRTADIELTLTIGVHGPAKMVVFLLEEPDL